MEKDYRYILNIQRETFSPYNFKETFYAEPNQHPNTPTLCSAVFPILRNKKNKNEIKLVEGTATWAEPGGLINSQTWNYLKNKILSEIKKAGKLDIIILIG